MIVRIVHKRSDFDYEQVKSDQRDAVVRKHRVAAGASEEAGTQHCGLGLDLALLHHSVQLVLTQRFD